MDIIEALKANEIRIGQVNRWLVWDKLENAWVVRGREYRQRTTRIVVTTGDENLAIKYLLYKES